MGISKWHPTNRKCPYGPIPILPRWGQNSNFHTHVFGVRQATPGAGYCLLFYNIEEIQTAVHMFLGSGDCPAGGLPCENQRIKVNTRHMHSTTDIRRAVTALLVVLPYPEIWVEL